MTIDLSSKKKGAASFYIVAIATLMLLIIVSSFATLIVSEMTRTSNADLSQSAYDAAMAGVEDAKLAYINYMNCKRAGYSASRPESVLLSDKVDVACGKIIAWMESDQSSPSCDMVAMMLGRSVVEDGAGDGVGVGVAINENNTDDASGGNNMQQYYTCVTIDNTPTKEVREISAYQTVVFKPVFDGDSYDSINAIKIDWEENNDKPLNLSVSIVQTGENSKNDMESFRFPSQDEDKYTGTNTGTVFLEPCQTSDNCNNSVAINAETVMESNDKKPTKEPIKVGCGETDCTVIIELPRPYDGGIRSDFEVVITGYGEASGGNEVAIEYCKAAVGDDEPCKRDKNGKISLASVVNQFVVDSTGRANDLYKRVRVTLDADGGGDSMVKGPLMLGDGGLVKNVKPTVEHDF